MKKITVSAPGKLMLFGEHAVLDGYPCIVTAMSQRIKATVELLDIPELQIEAPDVKITGYKKPMNALGQGDIPKGAKFVEIAVKNFLETRSKAQEVREFGFRVKTSSEFSSQFGFGSSSASTVCMVKACNELLDQKLSNKELFDIAYKTVLDIQGGASGFDVAAAIYGCTLYFVIGGKVIEPLEIETFPLVIGYSGIKADSVTMMHEVKERFSERKDEQRKIYENIGTIVEKAKPALLANNWDELGRYMNENQMFLEQLGVSTSKLDAMIDASINAGAFGAKLSGGGGGDCMIALVPQDKKEAVKKAITAVGGIIMDVNPNAEGARIEYER